MITIHHLGVSQSDRVVWLMEELGLPYDLKWYDRGPDNLAPPEYLALHPAATAPVIEDDGRVLTESAVVLEHICHQHADGRLAVTPQSPDYADYLYWMQLNNNLLGLFFANRALAAVGGADGENKGAERMRGLLERRETGYLDYMEQRLGSSPYLAGDAFSCADIMCAFALTSLPPGAPRPPSDRPAIKAYLDRIKARPAYQRAMALAGPKATRPVNA